MKKASKVQIAQNYAKALYEASKLDNNLEHVINECKLINDVFAEVKELGVLYNPELQISKKYEIISEISKQLKVSKTVENFLKTLVENNRFIDLKTILERFYQIYYLHEDMMEVSVQSVQPLNEKQQKKLLKGLEKLLNKKIIINYKINPEVLGGLVVEFGSSRIDDSIKGKLNRLEQVMKGNV